MSLRLGSKFCPVCTRTWSHRRSNPLIIRLKRMISGRVPSRVMSFMAPGLPRQLSRLCLKSASSQHDSELRPCHQPVRGAELFLDTPLRLCGSPELRQHGQDHIVARSLDASVDFFLGDENLVDLLTRPNTGLD